MSAMFVRCFLRAVLVRRLSLRPQLPDSPTPRVNTDKIYMKRNIELGIPKDRRADGVDEHGIGDDDRLKDNDHFEVLYVFPSDVATLSLKHRQQTDTKTPTSHDSSNTSPAVLNVSLIPNEPATS